MDAATLLRELKDRGVILSLRGENLIARPASLVKDLADEIRANKPAILEALRREGPPYPDGLGRVKCFYCTRLVEGVCEATGERMLGASLLIECGRFVMTVIH